MCCVPVNHKLRTDLFLLYMAHRPYNLPSCEVGIDGDTQTLFYSLAYIDTFEVVSEQ